MKTNKSNENFKEYSSIDFKKQIKQPQNDSLLHLPSDITHKMPNKKIMTLNVLSDNVFENKKDDKKRKLQSLCLVGNEKIEEYFKRVKEERLKIKTHIEKEIEEQKLSLSKIFPQLHLKKKLKEKWFRVRTKLKLHVSLLKSHKEIKLYGVNHNFSNKYKESLLEEEIPKSKVILDKTLFHDDSQFKSIWSFILFILLMYTAYVTPIQIAFVDNYSEPLKVLEYIVNILFILDMFVTMNSSFYDSNNQIVQSRRKIIKNYIQGWFFIDLLAAFPFEILENNLFQTEDDTYVSFRNISSNNFQQLLKLPRIYRLFRLARLIKMITKTKKSKYLMKIQEIFKLNSGFISLINYLIIISVAINFVGCMWFFEAKIRGFEPDTWVYELQLIDEDDFVLYIYSIYWAIQTLSTVGYGDVHAFNMMERFLCILWMSCGAGFYSYSVGSLSAVITNLDTRKAKLRKKRIILDEFCKENAFSKALHLKMRKALEYASIKSLFTVDEKIEFLRELPTDLKYEISKLTREKMLINYPFFKDKDKLFIAEFVLFLSPVRFHAKEILYEKGQYPTSIYFIMTGKVGLIEGPEKMVFKEYVPGGYFGEIEIFADIERICTVQALMDCEFLTIDRHEFLIILNNFPDIKKELQEISVEKRKRIMENLNNAQALLSLSPKSTFWFKRRKTIRSFNLPKMDILKSSLHENNSKRKITRIFQLVFKLFIRMWRCGHKSPKQIINPSLNEASTSKENIMKRKNRSILEYLDSFKQRKTQFANNFPTEMEKFANIKKPSLEQNQTVKGILKVQMKQVQDNDSKIKEEKKRSLPWRSNLHKKSKSLVFEKIKGKKETISKSFSLGNFCESAVKCYKYLKSSSHPKTQELKNKKFLLIDKKPQNYTKEGTMEQIKKNSAKWQVLEDETQNILNKLQQTNKKLEKLKQKMLEKKEGF